MPRMATLCSDHTRSPGLQAGAEPLQDLLKVLQLRCCEALHCRQRSRNGVSPCLQAVAEPLQACLLRQGGALPALQQKGRILCWHCHTLQVLGTRMQQYKSRGLAYPACAWRIRRAVAASTCRTFCILKENCTLYPRGPNSGEQGTSAAHISVSFRHLHRCGT